MEIVHGAESTTVTSFCARPPPKFARGPTKDNGTDEGGLPDASANMIGSWSVLINNVIIVDGIFME